MALNFDEIGKPLVQYGKRIISIHDKPVPDGFSEYDAKGEFKFQQIPDKNTERSILYITAPSGSGKSFYTREYIKQYHKMYPKRDIFVFSSLEDDPTLDALKYLKRIKVKSQAFLESDIGASDFKDSLCIFDDCDCISDKLVKKQVFNILNSILETGRHFNISVVYTSHNSCAGNETKKILNECHSITIFPRTAGNRTLKYLLDSYFGFNKQEIEAIKTIKTRWVTITKTFPQIMYTENSIWTR
jgi:hypothetical protein